MSLTSGTRLGPYEIQSPLGAGGMGEVYRAKDTRLDRTVAIKILVSHLSSSPELKQRMEREAKAISSLNHPHICQLYDIGSQDGTDYLVMEFLEGETLGERLRKGAISLNEILSTGIAIAQALAVAHRQGIVHRDLKPGNIMLTRGGAKLMDFGLAKPVGVQTSSASSGTVPSFTAVPTLSGPSPLSPLTTAGSIVGTIQYMSPEQIEGREADARSDIFAFGAVLYEMAAGKRPFAGKSQISLASSILESDPEPLSTLNPQTPPALQQVVQTCLQKNPEERFQNASDIKLQLQWIATEKAAPPSTVATHTSSSRRDRWLWVSAIVAALLIGVLGGIFLHRPDLKAQSIRTVINPPEKTTLNLIGDVAGPLVLSPDGAMIAFAATGQDGKSAIWVRPMNSLEARALPGTDHAIFPFWSPDGRSLGYFSDAKLKTIDLNGDAQQVICDTQLGRGGAWSPEGVIVYSPGPSMPLFRVSASGGGTPVALTKIDPALHTSHRWPLFLPDGKHFVYLALHHDPSKAANNTLYFASLDGHENRALFQSQSNAIYSNGYLLFARGDQLMAQRFDPAKGVLSGEPRTVAKGVATDPSTWHVDASAAADLLVFGSGGSGDLQLIWLDRNGKQAGTVLEKVPGLQTARVAPQGDRVALQLDAGVTDIWVLDLARGVRTRLTFGPVANTSPVWSPDGKWIAYFGRRAEQFGIFRKQTDGSGAEELLGMFDQQAMPTQWASDGKHLLLTKRDTEGHGQIWSMPIDGDRKPSMVVPRGSNGQLSPDGRWLAFSSSESGLQEVYVVAFGGGQGKWQVSANGGTVPQWSKDGKELYYMDPTNSLLTVPVKSSGGALQFGVPQTLVKNWTIVGLQFFDVSPDGKKILLDRVAQQVSSSVTVVTNFAAELNK